MFLSFELFPLTKFISFNFRYDYRLLFRKNSLLYLVAGNIIVCKTTIFPIFIRITFDTYTQDEKGHRIRLYMAFMI